MSRLVILKIFTLEAWIVRQFFFVSSAYFFVKLKHSLIKKVFANWCASTRHNFIFWSKIWNFRGFRVFDFGPYTKIENSESSEIVSALVKLIDFFCFFERKLESCEISEFSVLTLMLKSETWKIFQNTCKACKVSLFCLRKL